MVLESQLPHKIVDFLFTITNADNKLTISGGSWLPKTINLKHCVKDSLDSGESQPRINCISQGNHLQDFWCKHRYPLSIKRGINRPVRARFWPWPEPFLVRESLKPFNLFSPHSAAIRPVSPFSSEVANAHVHLRYSLLRAATRLRSYISHPPDRLSGLGASRQVTSEGFIRTSLDDKYPSSMKIATPLDHVSHCKSASVTNWSNRWTFRVFIINTCRD